MNVSKDFFTTLITRLLWWLIFCIYLLGFWPLPKSFHEVEYSKVILSVEGHILSARVTSSGQWHFPPLDSLPKDYVDALLLYEDQYFYHHPGINPVAMGKAIWNNITNGTRRGGSTITLQLARILHGNKPRTVFQKLREIITALSLEIQLSKAEILSQYAARAPMGRNIIGLHAAAFRYFDRAPQYLSHAEAAALAVLPNAPGLIYPGSGREAAFKRKRDFVLKKMLQNQFISQEDFGFATAEPLPSSIFEFDDYAPHTNEMKREKAWQETNLESQVQKKIQIWVNEKAKILSQQGVRHLAVLVMDLEQAKVKAYVGNKQGNRLGDQVNMVVSYRSVGSLLKPFLYGKSLDQGLILPQSLLADLPRTFGSYAPKNFDEDYFGAHPADICLSESRNIPFVDLLQFYNLDKFYSEMQGSGLELPFTAEHYGLAYILGGAEADLFNMAYLFRNLWAIAFDKKLVHYPDFFSSESKEVKELMSSISAKYTLLAMQKHPNSKGLSFKTGTSFGHRDAWAIGLDQKYLVAIWCGNADNEAVEGLTGFEFAVPIMKEVFHQLGVQELQIHINSKRNISVCTQSGYRASSFCDSTTRIKIHDHYIKSPVCHLCKPVAVDSTVQWSYSESCLPDDYVLKNYFVLPPAMEYFYLKRNIQYVNIPPLHEACEQNQGVMEIISPANNEKIFLPKKLDRSKSFVVIKAYHRIKNERIIWLINGVNTAETLGEHTLSIQLEHGEIEITLLDSKGNFLDHRFEIVEQF